MASNLVKLGLAVGFGAFIGPLIQPAVLTHLSAYDIQPHLPFKLDQLLPVSFNLDHLLNRRSSSSSASSTPSTEPTTCPPHNYTTQVISFSPLLIYITSFLAPSEAASIISLGEPLLEPSPITGYGRGRGGSSSTLSGTRTSWSAPLHPSSSQPNHVINCILSRAQSFMGTLLSPGRDEMGLPQLVRYTAGQKFDLHTDWFLKPRIDDLDLESGRQRLYNRVATFFVVLQANHTSGGETWFPKVGVVTPQDRERDRDKRVWREHEDGGLAFKAVPGGALFWLNLLPNGTGDPRTVHAGLPVEGGVKYAMNIWPRAFFGPDA